MAATRRRMRASTRAGDEKLLSGSDETSSVGETNAQPGWLWLGRMLAAFSVVQFVLYETDLVQSPTVDSLLLMSASWSGVAGGLIPTAALPFFKWREPFQGGSKFILLQTHGFMLLGSITCLSFVLALSPSEKSGLAAVGFSLGSFFGTAIIHYSLRFFEPFSNKLSGYRYRLLSPTSIPASALAVIGLVFFILSEINREPHPARSSYFLLSALVASSCSVAYTHLITSLEVPGYRYFMPFRGGQTFVVVQGEGWLLISTALNFGLARWMSGDGEVLNMTGMVLIFGVMAFMGDLLMIISLTLFRDDHDHDRERDQDEFNSIKGTTSMVLYVLGIVLAVMPPLILYLVKGLGVVGVHDYIGVTPRTLIFCMLASAPLSHVSGVVSWRDYNLVMPLEGGFEFMMTQGMGWFLYGIGLAAVIIMALNEVDSADLEHVIPLLFFAQASISVSTRYFREPRKNTPEQTAAVAVDEGGVATRTRSRKSLGLAGKSAGTLSGATDRDGAGDNASGARRSTPVSGPSEVESLDGDINNILITDAVAIPRVVVFGLVALMGAGSYLCDPLHSPDRMGWLLLFGLIFITQIGLHMVWTHVWLVSSAAIILTGNTLLLSSAAMLGLNISCVWYGTLLRKRELGVPGRAMHGWSQWICEDLLGGLAEWRGNVSYKPIDSLMTGFLVTDIGVHLLPTLILLQLSAAHISFLSVVLGYLASRVWSLAITSHHVSIDWTALRTAGIVRVRRCSQAATAYVDSGIINLIYGFSPPAPKAFFHHAVMVEAITATFCSAVSVLPIEQSTRTSVFMAMGLGPAVPVGWLIRAACICVVVGGSTIGGGAVLAYSLRPKGRQDQGAKERTAETPPS